MQPNFSLKLQVGYQKIQNYEEYEMVSQGNFQSQSKGQMFNY